IGIAQDLADGCEDDEPLPPGTLTCQEQIDAAINEVINALTAENEKLGNLDTLLSSYEAFFAPGNFIPQDIPAPVEADQQSFIPQWLAQVLGSSDVPSERNQEAKDWEAEARKIPGHEK